MIRVQFRIGTLRLRGDDTPRLEKAVERLRDHAHNAVQRARDYDAAAKRLRAALLRAAEEAFLGG